MYMNSAVTVKGLDLIVVTDAQHQSMYSMLLSTTFDFRCS